MCSLLRFLGYFITIQTASQIVIALTFIWCLSFRVRLFFRCHDVILMIISLYSLCHFLNTTSFLRLFHDTVCVISVLFFFFFFLCVILWPFPNSLLLCMYVPELNRHYFFIIFFKFIFSFTLTGPAQDVTTIQCLKFIVVWLCISLVCIPDCGIKCFVFELTKTNLCCASVSKSFIVHITLLTQLFPQEFVFPKLQIMLKNCVLI